MRLRLHFPTLTAIPNGWSLPQWERLQQVAVQAFERAVTSLNIAGTEIEFVHSPQERRVHHAALSVPEDFTRHFTAEQAAYTAVPVRKPGTMHETQVDIAQQRNTWPEVHRPGDSDLFRAIGMPIDAERQQRRNVQFEAPPDSNPEMLASLAIEVDARHLEGPFISTGGDDVFQDSFPEVAVIQEKGSNNIYAGGSPYVKAQNIARALHWGSYLFGNDGFAVLQPRGSSPEGAFYVIRLLGTVRLEESHTFTLESGEQAIAISAGMLQPPDYSIVTVVDDKGRSFFEHRTRDLWNYTRVKQALARIPQHERAIDPLSIREVVDAQSNQIMPAPSTHGLIDIIAWMDRTLFAAMLWARRAAYLDLLIAAWKTERERVTLLEIICSTRTQAELEAIFALLRRRGKYEKLFERFDERLYELLLVLGDFVADDKLDWRYLATVISEVELPSQSGREGRRDTQQGPVEELRNWLQNKWESISFLFGASDEINRSLEYLFELLWVVERAQYDDLQAQLFVTETVMQTGTASQKAMRGLQYARELGTPYNRRESEVDINHLALGGLQAAFILEVLKVFSSNDEICSALRAAGSQSERLEALTRVLSTLQVGERATAAGEGSDMTEQMARGFDALLESTQWDRTAIVDLIASIPTTYRHGFLYTMLFVNPSHLEMWDMRMLKGLSEHPGALELIREAGYELFEIVFYHAGHSWEHVDFFFEKLIARRKDISDPVAYQWFLYNLSRGEAAAFDAITYPAGLSRTDGPIKDDN